MPSSGLDIDEARALQSRSKTDPDSVELSTALDLLDSSESELRRIGLKIVGAVEIDPDQADEVLRTVCDRFEDDDLKVRYMALDLVSEIYPYCTDETNVLVSRLADQLDDDSIVVRQIAVSTLVAVGRDDPNAVKQVTSQVTPLLDSDETSHRERAVTFLAVVASEHPEQVQSAFPRLVELAGETYEGPEIAHGGEPQHTSVVRKQVQQEQLRYQRIRVSAVLVLTEIVRVTRRDEHIREAAAALSDHLRDENEFIREAVVDLYVRIGERAPEFLEAAQPILIETLLDTTQSDSVQGKAAWALAYAAEVDAETIARSIEPSVDTLHSLLVSSESDARRGAAGLSSYLAEEHPDLVAPATDQLVELLADQHRAVRGNAVVALGFVGCTHCLDRLRQLRTDDSDPDVREAAASALDQIEGRA